MKVNQAATRPFARLAASLLGDEHLTALDEGRCPMCTGPITEFRDSLSAKEFNISGMCQDCQDRVFAEPKED